MGSLRRARVAIWAYFFVAGVVIATWASRIPSVKAQAGLDDGALSLALLGLATGALVSMQIAGRVADRIGSGPIIFPAAICHSMSLVLPGYARSLPALAGALVLLGLGHGMVAVPMNLHAARLERQYGRPIMASFHAGWSIGGFVGAGVGALAAHAGLTAVATFWIVAIVLVALSVSVSRWTLPGRDSEPVTTTAGDAPPLAESGRRATVITILAAIAYCSFLSEAATADWSAVHLDENLHASGAAAAFAYSLFSAMMAFGRLFGDRVIARFGAVAVVRAGALLAAAGLAASLLVPVVAIGVIGFGLVGAGLSCTVPQVFVAASNRDPSRAGRNLALVAGGGYIGFLSGPILIGATAHATELSVGLTIPLALILIIAAAAGALCAARSQPA